MTGRRGRRESRARGPITVLMSVPPPRPTTNPYVVELMRGLDAEIDVRVLPFCYRTALTGRYSVFHTHWPENLVAGATPWKGVLRRLLFAVLLLRIRIVGTTVVRTVHNLDLPSGLSGTQRRLLAALDHLTAFRIVLNEHSGLPAGLAQAVVAHPDYRHWYADVERPQPVPGRLAFVGGVRRYKGVERLVTAFRDTDPADGLTLRIAGRPTSDELAAEIELLAAADPRITLDWRFLSEAEIAAEIGSAELVVLPYTAMHNSGAVLLALSLGRPALVPDNPVNRDLADEVGPGWLYTYTGGGLDATDLTAALTSVRNARRSDEPDLSARDWPTATHGHVAAYRRALAVRD